MNIFLALVLVTGFVYFATNAGEHPLHRPGLRPAVTTAIIGLIGCMAWAGWIIGK